MKKLIAIVLLFSQIAFAQEVLDRIAAIVDNEIILQSEVEFRAGMLASQQNLNPEDAKIKESVLNQIIEEKLIYAQAELDSIVISDDEVGHRIDSQMQYLIQQAGSKERLEEMYKMSVARIKRKMNDDVRKTMMIERIRQEKFGKIEVTIREVEKFYEAYKDSLGQIPERYDISHIFRSPKAGSVVKDKARAFAQSLLDSIKGGADFETLANENSDDPGSKNKGGDLGFAKRGVFFPEFESAAFRLDEGDLSEVVESPVGFHIIQLLERRGESIHSRHILITVDGDDDADIRAIEFLSDIRDSIMKEVNTFEYFARKVSEDKQTAKYGGKLGVYELEQLNEDKSLKDQIYKLDEGEIGFPKRLQVSGNKYGFHIVRLNKRTMAHMPTLEEDFNDIKKIAEVQKSQKIMKKWVESLKEKIYWEIKI